MPDGWCAMKKFVLAMSCTVLMVMLIALNYLLWDKENKEKSIKDLESSNMYINSSINALNRENEKLANENKQLKDKIIELEDENERLKAQNLQSELDKTKINGILAHKYKVIDKLKEYADAKFLANDIAAWIESLGKGEYETAYKLLQTQMANQNEVLSPEDFASRYKNIVRSASIKSLEFYTGYIPEDKKGEIVIKVLIEIKKADDKKNVECPFVEGVNERLVIVDFDGAENKWVITGIYSSF